MITLSHLLSALILLSLLSKESNAKLFVSKVLLVSEDLQIDISTKFKFTDVMMTSRTISALNITAVNSMEEIPEVPIINRGRIEKKYHSLDGDDGLYVMTGTIDSQQLTSFFLGATEHHGKIDFYILQTRAKQLLKGFDLNSRKVCFVDGNLTSSVRSTSEIREIAKACLAQLELGRPNQREGQFNPKKSKFSISFSEGLAGIAILTIFWLAKLGFIYYYSKKDSVI